jgi:tRNA-splicing ligase RtcB
LSQISSKYPIKKISEVEYRIEANALLGMKVPVTIFANKELLMKMLSDRTIDQGVNVSQLPGIYKHVVILPDGHEGYGFPIGGVAVTDSESGVISPGGVGYDINCGVRLLQTNLLEKDVRPNAIPSGLGSKGRVKLKPNQLNNVLQDGVKWAIESGYGNQRDAEFCEENGRMEGADPNKVSPIAKSRGVPQLGSLGSGNHFLEIQIADKIFDERVSNHFGINKEGQVAIMIHTGSRGLGYQVCSDYLKIIEIGARKFNISLPDRELASVPNNSKEARDYRAAMAAALNYAWSNRQMITHWTRKVFEKVFKMTEDDLGLRLVYDVAHNIAKFEEHNINGKRRKVVVHRKGATRAFPSGSKDIPIEYQKIGQPVLIPGSMGTGSYVLLGKEKSMDLSFGSTAHGAGRKMSRAAAIRTYRAETVRRELEHNGIIVRSASWKGIAEEAPGAYKDVDSVADVSHRAGIATKVIRFRPIGTIKG